MWFVLTPLVTAAAQPAPRVITADIDRFWQAHDRIVGLSDTLEQQRLFSELYVMPGTPGLAAMMQARRYTVSQYVAAINRWPRYWQSIRPLTQRAASHAQQIAAGMDRLRAVYPMWRSPTVYFVIGVLRSGGTIQDSMVMIGAESALADRSVVTDEFPPRMQRLRALFDSDPVKDIVQLNVHEVVHTQQRDHPYRLLHRALNEGIAEYVSTIALGVPSPWPAIRYAQTQQVRVRERFAEALLSPQAIDRWLYNDTNNEFGIRDLGYGVGFAIASGYVRNSGDSARAVRELVDLDYADSVAVARIVDRSGYFATPLATLARDYEARRPRVVDVKWGSATPHPTSPDSVPLRTVHFMFSVPMDTTGRGFDFGPGGEPAALLTRAPRTWAADRRSFSVTVAPVPGREYELLLTERFMSDAALPLVPYLLRTRAPAN
jgi:hypothetical protein